MKSHIVKDLVASELKNYLKKTSEDKYLLFDVREPKEYKLSHIPGSILIPLKEIETRIFDFNLQKDLIFYCRSGRRSKIAANFIADMGLETGELYNLKGGILSWEGKILKDFPNIRLFDFNDSPPSILKKAMEMEKGTERFYGLLAMGKKDKGLADFFNRLKKLELSHAKVIYSILKKISPDIPEFNELYESLGVDVLEGGMDVSQLVEQFLDDNLSCVDIFETALDIEFHAYDLYKNLSFLANDPEGARTFLKMSQQEKGHIRIISHYLSKCF